MHSITKTKTMTNRITTSDKINCHSFVNYNCNANRIRLNRMESSKTEQSTDCTIPESWISLVIEPFANFHLLPYSPFVYSRNGNEIDFSVETCYQYPLTILMLFIAHVMLLPLITHTNTYTHAQQSIKVIVDIKCCKSNAKDGFVNKIKKKSE